MRAFLHCSCGQEAAVESWRSEGAEVGGVAFEPNAAAEGGGVEIEQGTKLGATRDDEVGGQQGRHDVVLGVEGDVIDGGGFGAEGDLDSGQGGFEQREPGGLGELVEDGWIGQWDGDHGPQRFLGAAAFLGAG